MSPWSQLVFVHALFDVTMIVPTTVTVMVGVALRAHTGGVVVMTTLNDVSEMQIAQ